MIANDKIPLLLRQRWNTIREDVLKHYEGNLDELLKVVTTDRDQESDEVKTKRKATLKPMTKEPLFDAIDNYKGNFGDYDYSIQNAGFEPIKTPTGFKKIEDYYLNDGVEYFLTRPNSFIWIRPYVESGDMPATVRDTVERKIELLEVYSEDVTEITPDYIVFTKEGLRWKITKEKTVILIQKDDRVEELLYCTNYHDSLPIIVNGGYIKTIRGRNYGSNEHIYKYYESIFSPIIPKLDDYLSAWSDLKMVNSYHSAPIKQVLGVDCKTCNGTGLESDDNGRWLPDTVCKECNGAKTVYGNLTSTGALVVLNKDGSLGSDYPQKDAVKYIEAPVGSLDYFQKQEERKYRRMRQSLFLEFEESANASGKSREINRKKQDVHYKMVGNMIFGNLKALLNIIQSYKIIQESLRDAIHIITPIDYSIKNESDLLSTLKEMPVTAPSFLKRQVAYDYASKILSNDPIRSLINDFMFRNDILYGADENSIITFKASYVEGSQDLSYIIDLHYKGEQILLEIHESETDISDLTNKQLKEKVDAQLRRADTIL